MNLFDGLPADLPDELFETLAGAGDVRIERIVSRGHRSPDGFWYDQPLDEWVVVLRGSARLRFEDEVQAIDLNPGDHVLIAAHRKHRVESTDAREATVWLAVNFP